LVNPFAVVSGDKTITFHHIFVVQMSRAAVTFAVLQTEERTHTLGEDEDGVDENATRAAPFTMASQWQGISALNSSGADDDSVNEDLDDKV
jgi:hypothetical protein